MVFIYVKKPCCLSWCLSVPQAMPMPLYFLVCWWNSASIFLLCDLRQYPIHKEFSYGGKAWIDWFLIHQAVCRHIFHRFVTFLKLLNGFHRKRLWTPLLCSDRFQSNESPYIHNIRYVCIICYLFKIVNVFIVEKFYCLLYTRHISKISVFIRMGIDTEIF